MNCDLMVTGEFLLPMDKKMSIIRKGAVVVTGDKITAVGSLAQIKKRYRAGETITSGSGIVMPGLINTHTHAAMTYFRGLADDLPLDIWLKKYIWPAEAKFVDPVFVRKASELACLEMVKAGVTCFNDMYFFPEITAAVAKKAGMRAVVGECIINFPSPSSQTPDDAIARSREALQGYKNDVLISVFLNPHSLYALALPYLEKVKRLADEYRVPIHMHISETKKEVDDCLKAYGRTPVQLLFERELLSDKVIAVHSVWLTDGDIEVFRRKNVKVSHNPISNMKLASGISPVIKILREKGITVGLATDGAASNNVLDLFSDMKAASLLHKISNMDPAVFKAREAVKMATIDGAKVLGMERSIGSLEAGKQADIITIDLEAPHLQPIYDPYSHLVYCVNSSDVRDVVINGRVIMRNKKVLTIDEKKAVANAKKFSFSYS
jgi:5-methylthioadenosine/S-adenosylhomocysteine deaminase